MLRTKRVEISDGRKLFSFALLTFCMLTFAGCKAGSPTITELVPKPVNGVVTPVTSTTSGTMNLGAAGSVAITAGAAPYKIRFGIGYNQMSPDTSAAAVTSGSHKVISTSAGVMLGK